MNNTTFDEFCKLDKERTKDITSHVYNPDDGPLHALNIDQTQDGLFLPEDAKWIAACSVIAPKMIKLINAYENFYHGRWNGSREEIEKTKDGLGL